MSLEHEYPGENWAIDKKQNSTVPAFPDDLVKPLGWTTLGRETTDQAVVLKESCPTSAMHVRLSLSVLGGDEKPGVWPDLDEGRRKADLSWVWLCDVCKLEMKVVWYSWYCDGQTDSG